MRRAVAGLGFLALAGCVAVPTPTEADLPAARALVADATLADLAAGRALYVGKCSSCHALHAPAAFDDAAWRVHLRAMQPRARIDAATAERIWLFLATCNDPARPGGG